MTYYCNTRRRLGRRRGPQRDRLTGVLCFVLAFLSSPVLCRGTSSGVWICRKWYAVPPQYPQNADVQLRNDQAFCTELQGELKTALFGMCSNNPTLQGKPRHADTKAALIFKHVFCNYL